MELNDRIDSIVQGRLRQRGMPLDVEVLRLQPGDVLAVHVGEMPQETAAAIGDWVISVLTQAGHADVPVAVFIGNARLAVVRPEEAEEAPDGLPGS